MAFIVGKESLSRSLRDSPTHEVANAFDGTVNRRIRGVFVFANNLDTRGLRVQVAGRLGSDIGAFPSGHGQAKAGPLLARPLQTSHRLIEGRLPKAAGRWCFEQKRTTSE
jgi:hypothetical protein